MNITISLTEEVKKELDNQAKEYNRTRSAHIKELVSQGVLYMTFKLRGGGLKSYKLADIEGYDDDGFCLILTNGEKVLYETRYLESRSYSESRELVKALMGR